MSLQHQQPLVYLITSGATTSSTDPASNEFQRVLQLVRSAVAAKIDLLQLREKNLLDKVLYELSLLARSITKGTQTRLLINDRADIARAAEADGVHLTSRSLPVKVVRDMFGPDFLIGVSTHSALEVVQAAAGGADFAVFGPVFETESKLKYGEPQGLDKLRAVTQQTPDFPVLALGGVNLDNASDCNRAGAAGIAAISLLNDQQQLPDIVKVLRSRFTGSSHE
ncbi:MAG TPA: thiamine phosphate synthase [Pyrinomonadaceae bacterium]|jgi:thiamine-phosphate pyrophosphorylase